MWFILNCWSNYKVSLRFIIASLFIIATKRLKYDMIFFLSKKQHVQIIRKKWPNLTCVYCRWVLKHNFFWKDLFISVGVCTEKVHNSLAQFPHSKKKTSMNSLIRICSFGFRWHFEGKKKNFFYMDWIQVRSLIKIILLQQQSIPSSHFLFFCQKKRVSGGGAFSNTLGPRCLNSGPWALICAYQRRPDNPGHSSSVNQEQIELR